jgi:hypothetical protein
MYSLKVAVHPATPHQVFTHPRTPPLVAPPIHPSCVFTDSRVVCHYSCLVNYFASVASMLRSSLGHEQILPAVVVTLSRPDDSNVRRYIIPPKQPRRGDTRVNTTHRLLQRERERERARASSRPTEVGPTTHPHTNPYSRHIVNASIPSSLPSFLHPLLKAPKGPPPWPMWSTTVPEACARQAPHAATLPM